MSDPHNTAPVKKRCLLKIIGVLFVIALIACIYLLLFPAPIVRFALNRLEAKEGIAVTFEKAYLDLGKRALALENVSARRQNHPEGNFDFQAKIVHIDIPPQSRHPNGSAFLTISELSGTYERISKNVPDEKKNENDTKTENSFWNRGKQWLMLTNSRVSFVDKTPERPFQGAIQFEILDASYSSSATESVLGSYFIRGTGLINTDTFFHIAGRETQLKSVPIALLSPYAPILNDIFVAGSVNIDINDLTDKIQKKILVKVFLQKDCRIKSADEILAPAVQLALQKLDQSSLPALHELRTKIADLRTVSESIRNEIDKAAPIVEALKALAPRDVREKYERFKSQYDRLRNAPEELDAQLKTLLQELDQMKAGIVNDTFRHFIETGTPIEFYVNEEDGEWQCDWEAVLSRLIEQNYQTLIATQYQKRIQEMLDSVNRLLIP